ncbi:MAG: family transporter [Solirubrobacterales bacterium]|nr:family transporter [Solirubrobacterales bacterium]
MRFCHGSTLFPSSGRMTRLYARFVVWLRWPLALAVIGGVAYAAIQLPTLESVKSGALGNLVPPKSQAIRAEQDAYKRFGVPILSRTLIVQRDAAGLSDAEQREIVDRAAAAREDKRDAVLGAAPFINRKEVTAAGREHDTTAITGLFFSPNLDPFDQPDKARVWVQRTQPAHNAGITGSLPAQVAQSDLVFERLPIIEIATALLVALLVGLYFRSLVAPVLTVGTVAMAYLLTDRMLAQLALHQDVSIPQEVHPVIVVLLFGVVTDYSIFYLSRARQLLRQGRTRLEAAREATVGITGIITAAAVTVAGASMALYASNLSFLKAFGPGMAGSVLLAWLVVVIFIPVALGILGTKLFWPNACKIEAEAEEAQPAAVRESSALVRFSVRHPVVVSAMCLLALGAAVSGVGHMRLGNPIIASLPGSSEERRAYEAVSTAVGPGAVAPTVVLVTSPGVERKLKEVATFQNWLEEQPGVAHVIGPTQASFNEPRELALKGDDARFVVLFKDDPMGGKAVHDFQELKADSGRGLRDAGLPEARVVFAGDTAVTAEMVDATTSNLLKIGAVVLALLFLILAVYLRAVVAPLYLLATSVIALFAALGLTTYIFEDLLGNDGLSYFTVITAGVLLVALGSDYNVFLVGDIWKEAKRRPSREAITIAASRTSKPITIAGLVLALSFALLAIVPVTSFREIAVVMFLGLILDAFVVRTLLVPALISLFGSAGSWPGGRLRRRRDRSRLVTATQLHSETPLN